MPEGQPSALPLRARTAPPAPPAPALRASLAPDARPHLFQAAPGVFAPMACNGRGIASCTVVGRLCAAFAAGEPQPALPPEPPRPIPFQGMAAHLQGPVISLAALQDHLTP